MKYVAPFLAFAAALGTSDATPIERSYIARVSGSECESVTQRVSVLKMAIEGSAVASREAQPKMLSFTNMENEAPFCFVTFQGGSLLEGEISKLPGVAYVEQDQTFTISAPDSWGLDRIDQSSVSLDGNDYSSPYTGQGVTVFVVDTGINKDHVDFEGRASYGAEFVSESSRADQNGHGSHCAGTVGSKTYGVAKKAALVGVKVLSGQGSGSNSGVLQGIQWAVDNAQRASVISMSLGGGKSQATDDAVTAAANAGHLVIVAAGNDNANACNYSPAAAGGKGKVITVMATDKPALGATKDIRASYSSFGQCADIFAPGSGIKSVWKGSTTATNTISGTSMATPHVAGVAALLLEKHNFNVAAARAELFSSASVNTVSNPGTGSPNRMLQLPSAGNGNTPTTPPTAPTNPTPAPTVRVVPTPFPTVATRPPTRAWTCPNSWFGTSDGCDCECGGGDPDCSGTYTRLYCNGRPAASNQVCDFSIDRCIVVSGMTTSDAEAAGRTAESFPAKSSSPSEDSNALIYAGVGAGALAFAVVGAVVYKSRQTAQMTKSSQMSVVGSPDQL